jgi:predicted ATP-grasp superfamily ATP-dependent carboligase
VEAVVHPNQEPAGVLLLGGVHSALSSARSFGRKNIPVMLLADDHPLPRLSRYVRRSFRWPGGRAPHADEWLVKFATEHGLRNWLLIPCADPDVRFVAENLTRLASIFKLNCPDWTVLQKVCNKQLLAETAANAGVAFPKSYQIHSDDDAARTEVRFPVVLKPANRMERNAFTSSKAWQANSREELQRRYREAASMVGEDNVVVQELVPGGGEAQFSYAALWHDHAPVVEVTARRTRQYPIEFSTSTFVEFVSNDAVVAAGRQLLSSIRFEGLVEAEFKFDQRDHTYKVLDVNPRPWSWMGLCEISGMDFPVLMRDLTLGKAIKTGALHWEYGWIHVARDLLAALQLMCRGQMTLATYIKTLRRRLVFATFAWDDPLPGILELPLAAYRVLKSRPLCDLVKNGPVSQPNPATS